MRTRRTLLALAFSGLGPFMLVGETEAVARLTVSSGASCSKTADCGAGLYCAYRQPGCQGTRGRCENASCVHDPMDVPYCSCDGSNAGTASMCMPDRPFAKLGACSP